jgi:hypothetical protein
VTLIGMGLCPLGSCLFGLGLLDEPTEVKPKVFTQLDGSPGNAPLLQNGDYLLDARGREIGADAITMRVQLALETMRDSSAVKGFGLSLTLNTLRADTALQVQAAVRQALADLLSAKLISLVSVVVQPQDQHALVTIKWINLKSAKLQTSQITG